MFGRGTLIKQDTSKQLKFETEHQLYIKKMEQSVTENTNRKLEGMANEQNKCLSGKPLAQFCVNDICKETSMCCALVDCTTCYKSHSLCSFVPVQNLAMLIQVRKKAYHDAYVKVASLESQLHHQLVVNWNKIILTGTIYGYDQSLLQTLNSYDYVKTFPKGQDIAKLRSNLAYTPPYVEIQQQLQQYRRQGEVLAQKFIQLRLRMFMKVVKRNSQFDTNVFNEDPLGYRKIFNLLDLLDHPQSVKLLFRASQHNFSAAEFHKSCDGIQNTVTILRTQFGKTIAAFTPLQWNGNQNKVGYVQDAEGKSFILQLDFRDKLTLASNQQHNAIFNSPKYGPTFGGGHDLHLSDQCNQNYESFVKIPTSYIHNGKFVDEYQSLLQFCGSNDGRFKVQDYEVFQIIRK